MNRFMRFTGAVVLGAVCSAAGMRWLGTPVRADSTFSMSLPSARFVIRALNTGGGSWQTYRVDSTTGDSYFASAGKWVKISDAVAPGAGVYDVQLIALPDTKTYTAVRTDLATGRAWYIDGTKWDLITEP